MNILGFLLACNFVLHAFIVGRFGFKGNLPPALFGILYAGLAYKAFSNWAYATPVSLAVTAIGIVGLAANFKKLQHETTIEKIIFGVGAAIIIYASRILFFS